MKEIPVHKIHEKTTLGILLKHVEDGNMLQNGEDMPSVIADAHRDNYYLFILMEQGEAQMIIDFKEYHVQGIALGCILPGQVHHPITLANNVSA